MSSKIAYVAPKYPPANLKKLSPSGEKYAEALKATAYYFDAQRSGVMPVDNPVPWRRDSHLNDTVVGGWYDAGDFLKISFTMGVSVSYINWAMISFPAAFKSKGAFSQYKASIKWATDYLLDCYDEKKKTFIGQIGHPDIDHEYWGRPDEEGGERPVFIWDRNMAASDLLSNAAAAWASTAIVFRPTNPKYSALLIRKAKAIYAWAKSKEGKYSAYHKDAVYKIYPSSDYLDNQAWAAAWLYRATKDSRYLNDAASFWKRSYGTDPFKADIYTSWDSLWAPTAVLMRQLARMGTTIPGMTMYNSFYQNMFLPAWLKADGKGGIIRTPKGMTYPRWNIWANLAFSGTTAMVMIQDAKRNPNAAMKAGEIKYAQRNVDYILGSTGRSYIVGWGNSPPSRPHHSSSTCPDWPEICNGQNLFQKGPNGQVLIGAMVGGPAGVGRNRTNPDWYVDARLDWATNEPANDYNSGLTGALAGMWYYG